MVKNTSHATVSLKGQQREIVFQIKSTYEIDAGFRFCFI